MVCVGHQPHGFQNGNIEIKGFSATAMLCIAFINIFYCFVINLVSPYSTQPAEDGSAVDTTSVVNKPTILLLKRQPWKFAKQKIEHISWPIESYRKFCTRY